jgi:hypothetical protein
VMRRFFNLAGTRVAWGMGTRSNVQPSLLILELLHLFRLVFFFFQKISWLYALSLFQLVWSFVSFGKALVPATVFGDFGSRQVLLYW